MDKQDAYTKCKELIDRLAEEHRLEASEYLLLLDTVSGDTAEYDDIAEYAAECAVRVRKAVYGTDVYIRGLIEISSYCKNDCYYCGIRRSNGSCERYRLDKEQIMSCCERGYGLGFRTFVLQGGEDGYFTDERVCDIARSIKKTYPDCALTLSLGEKPRESYKEFFSAGADRYLLRHETADSLHYGRLHPGEQTLENRMRCLNDLKELGFQVGCGFMVGSPYQTKENIVQDLKFIGEFQPDMCGIGPFIPHHATPFAGFAAGSLKQTTFLLSLIRLICPHVLLPATTALGTISPDGREKGILAGANVIMPNLSPEDTRKKYMLYDNKAGTGDEAAEQIWHLKESMRAIGYTVTTSRGDVQYKIKGSRKEGKY